MKALFILPFRVSWSSEGFIPFTSERDLFNLNPFELDRAASRLGLLFLEPESTRGAARA